ncbi:MAG: sigma-70 family RNA polymerase sigma factor [Minicystis sp.]
MSPRKPGAGEERAARTGDDDEEGRRQLAALLACRRPLNADERRVLRGLFHLVYDDHYDHVREELRRRGVPEAARDDLAQGVFIGLFLRVLAGNGPEDVAAELSWRARTTAFNAGRAERRDPVSVGLPSSRNDPPRSGPELERLLDLKTLVPRVLPELSPDHRAVVEAVILREQTQEAAAAELGIPRPTLASRLATALKKLDTLLAPILPTSER